MLYEYKDVFSLRDEIGMCPNIEVNIEVTDNSPFFIQPYHVKEEDRAVFDKETRRLCKGLISLKIRTNFVSVVKLLPVYNMASSGLWKMFIFIILNHQNGVWENVYLYNIDTYDLLCDFWQMLCLWCQGRCNLPGRC